MAQRKLTSRDAFLFEELFKLRRLSYVHVQKLLCMSNRREAVSMLLKRLEESQFIQRDHSYVHCQLIVTARLLTKGYANVSQALQRTQYFQGAQSLDDEFLAHLFLATDLYLKIVTHEAEDWVAVKSHAAKFKWLPSNENTAFTWEEIGESSARKRLRRIIPDVVIENETHRYLVEIERSTKPLKVVERKFEHYNRLFSKLRTMSEKSPYQQKYSDDLKPVVVFVFENEVRARNVQTLFESRARSNMFFIPRYVCGEVGAVAQILRGELLSSSEVPSSITLQAEKTVPELSLPMSTFEHDVLPYVDALKGLLQEYAAIFKQARQSYEKKTPLTTEPKLFGATHKIVELVKRVNSPNSPAIAGGQC